MRIDKKRMQEIDEEMEVLMVAMKKAAELGDFVTYKELQQRYGQFYNMLHAANDEVKNKKERRIAIVKIGAELLGSVMTATVGVLGILCAVSADRNDIFVIQKPWAIAMDVLKRKK